MLAYLADLYADLVPRPLDAGEFAPPSGTFLILDVDGAAAACGGVRACEVAGAVGELKRLWVEPEHRNKGLARELLACLEARAVELGYERLYLDTGPLQAAAMRLYESSGYRSVPNYGRNAASTFLRAYEKVLSSPA
ncbi:MAG TPA: GNAT family N-acetyltransferase [Acidimicrobiales bacterium]|nr:GNAT family N-acetyltransferase [Acidimicrobiales bacterium]